MKTFHLAILPQQYAYLLRMIITARRRALDVAETITYLNASIPDKQV